MRRLPWRVNMNLWKVHCSRDDLLVCLMVILTAQTASAAVVFEGKPCTHTAADIALFSCTGEALSNISLCRGESVGTSYKRYTFRTFHRDSLPQSCKNRNSSTACVQPHGKTDFRGFLSIWTLSSWSICLFLSIRQSWLVSALTRIKYNTMCEKCEENFIWVAIDLQL